MTKNYLSQEEIAVLNRMVSAFFDLAELRAMQHKPMYMRDWVGELDDFAKRYGKVVLSDAGAVSHQDALAQAEVEYAKYRQKTITALTPVEQEYLATLKNTQKNWKTNKKTNPKIKLRSNKQDLKPYPLSLSKLK